jgi:hypothetical protein
MLCTLLPMLLLGATAAHAESNWQGNVEFAGRSARATVTADGYRLDANGSTLRIARQAATATTASVLVDALFALAQQELSQARVDSISDGAFDHGAAQACRCLQTGEKWPYVWTRDLAYATDLALYRFDPQRARNGLLFKLSPLRAAAPRDAAAPLYVVQDTGSGGSWPVSTDRVAWFLGAAHLLDDAGFAATAFNALAATLEQDRRYAFDAARGLYRGETSFLDWREQSYPAWTSADVGFIAESFALSTNVLHYQALRLGERLARARHDRRAGAWQRQAQALAAAIERAFWRPDRGLYMSYVGGDGAPRRIEAYDLLGTALAIVSGVAPAAHARRALANYPTWPAGSPVIWPEHADAAIYHNRAIWPFVSAYALKAARALDEPARIAHELRSILLGAALAGSNMENYEVTTLAVHVDDGARSGPVVNSPRQLWSVAAMLDAVVEGVFGLGADDSVTPKIPRALVPMLFGERAEIRLDLPGRSIVLVKPPTLRAQDNLLVADRASGSRAATRVTLRGTHVAQSALPLGREAYAPATPAPPRIDRDGTGWAVQATDAAPLRLYVDGTFARTFARSTHLPAHRAQQCVSLTREAAGIESLPSEPLCVGEVASVGGAWPRSWTAPASGRYRLRLAYRNAHGPINTGITAAVRLLAVRCGGATRTAAVVMPHGTGADESTALTFTARAGQRCTFALDGGFNMSELAHYRHYTGGEGGAGGAINEADYGDLRIVAL